MGPLPRYDLSKRESESKGAGVMDPDYTNHKSYRVHEEHFQEISRRPSPATLGSRNVLVAPASPSRTVDWNQVSDLIRSGRSQEAMEVVLQRGGLSDFARAMGLMGPKPEELSSNLRNTVFDQISVLLMQQQQADKCVQWVSALLRKKLAKKLVRNTQRNLLEGLAHMATEASDVGDLAANLEVKLREAIRL